MNCPRCGAETPPAAVRCTACGQSMPSTRPQAAAGVLTPPVPSEPLSPDLARLPHTTSVADLANAPTRWTDGPDRLPERIPASHRSAPSAAWNEDTTGLPGVPGGSRSETGPLRPGQAFGPRYHIIRLLGIGGMGAVYQAWDSELSVAVALKVIRPEATIDPGAARETERRFKQELLLARQVTHKNVVRIHDLGEIDGIKYITMSYIEGEDLATVLKTAGKLPVSAALNIARQVASGLLAAHEAGVVHRDLKPPNIMVEGDHAIIMDFGIARSTSRPDSMLAGKSASARGQNLAAAAMVEATMAGAVVGTVQYMAPEQAKGEAVDQRADIYAFGLIFSDMLLGRRTVSGAGSAIDELKARIAHAPPPIRSVDPEIPEALERIVSRCIEPDPAARFQTTADLVVELDRLDENGKPLPLVRRLTRRMMAATALLVIAMLGGTYYVTRRAVEPPKQHDPVSVVIADLQNLTNDPTFERSLEPILKLALESAPFISAYDRPGIRRSLGVRPPEKLDEGAARELAVKHGLGVVLSGSLDRQGNGYEISVKATQPVTGRVIINDKRRASNKDQVLGMATTLATAVRKALGDDTSDSVQRFAMDTLSATSLEAVRDYGAGMVANSDSKFEEARRSFLKAVERDPKFGMAWTALAAVSRNLDKHEDAEKYIKEAFRLLPSMTERERYRTRGSYYLATGDYQKCVKEYGDLVAQYAADASARNQLALCWSYLRNMPRAVDEMRQVVKIFPNRTLYRENLALYADYASDFQTGEQEARAIQEPGVFGGLALAFAQFGQGQLPEAIETYQKLATIDAQGASYATSGLGDLAIYEGRFLEAVRILERGATADLASNDSDRAAAKFASLAYAHLSRGQKGQAVAAAKKALTNSQSVKIRFLAARTFVEAGEITEARPLIAKLASELTAVPQAYAKIVEGEIALKTGDAREAIIVLNAANGIFETWIGHFDLGRAYLEAGLQRATDPGLRAFGDFTQADSEFDRCIKRRGEAMALFLDEEPTYGYFPSVYYYQGRVREGLKTDGFVDSYRTYLNIRGKSREDALVTEVRRRAGG